jgi:hypothetical protein
MAIRLEPWAAETLGVSTGSELLTMDERGLRSLSQAHGDIPQEIISDRLKLSRAIDLLGSVFEGDGAAGAPARSTRGRSRTESSPGDIASRNVPGDLPEGMFGRLKSGDMTPGRFKSARETFGMATFSNARVRGGMVS